MTRNDGSHNTATTHRRRLKGKRTTGVGRTGARFPAAHEEEPEEPTTPAAQPPAPTAFPTTTAATRTAPPAQMRSAQAATVHTVVPYAPSVDGTSGHEPFPRASPVVASPGFAVSPSASLARTASVSSPEAGYPAPGTSVADSVRHAGGASAADGADGDGDSGDGGEVVGRTGARFGPYSVRKTRRGKDFDTGSTPVVGDPALTTQPGVEASSGEPTPERSAERTQPLVKPWAGALVRPYAHTGGRTRSGQMLAIEALVSSSQPSGGDAVLTTHHRRMIVDLCARPRSVAEVAALLAVPLGVARVLLGDLATAGVVVVHPTAGTSGDGAPDLAFMQRVLVGLRRL